MDRKRHHVDLRKQRRRRGIIAFSVVAVIMLIAMLVAGGMTEGLGSFRLFTIPERG